MLNLDSFWVRFWTIWALKISSKNVLCKAFWDTFGGSKMFFVFVLFWIASKTTQEGPRDAQEAPGSPQDLPKSTPRGPKRLPRAPQEAPRESEETPRAMNPKGLAPTRRVKTRWAGGGDPPWGCQSAARPVRGRSEACQINCMNAKSTQFKAPNLKSPNLKAI